MLQEQITLHLRHGGKHRQHHLAGAKPGVEQEAIGGGMGYAGTAYDYGWEWDQF